MKNNSSKPQRKLSQQSENFQAEIDQITQTIHNMKNSNEAQVNRQTRLMENLKKRSSLSVNSPLEINNQIKDESFRQYDGGKREEVSNRHSQLGLPNRWQAKEGYDILRLIEPPLDHLNDDFLCGLCQKIVNEPYECQNQDCGQLFCNHCLNTGSVNCEVCQKDVGFRRPSPIVLKLLNSYQIKCVTCEKGFTLKELGQHETICQQSVCSNELCGVKLNEASTTKIRFNIMQQEVISCSKKCKKVTKFNFMLRQNNEQEILRSFESMLRKKLKKQQTNKNLIKQSLLPSQVVTIPDQNTKTNRRPHTQRNTLEEIKEQMQGIGPMSVQHASSKHLLAKHKLYNFYPDIHEFCWDPENSSKEINFSSDYRHAFLFETNYLFRTMISNRPFMDGVHYWEIIADSRTENELKIGVTTQQRFRLSNAFCDYDFGFGFYGLGQLRHGSNAEGTKYGKPFKKKGILGVCLDMTNGTLSFAIDGEYYGIAFEDPVLRRGPIWAAISLLHTGGCTLISGLDKPSYFV